MSRDSEKEDLRNYMNLAQIFAATSAPRSELYLGKILQRGIDIDYQVPASPSNEYSGNTALHFACRSESTTQSIGVLLDYGADVTIKNAKGTTVLHCVHRQADLREATRQNIGAIVREREATRRTVDAILDAQLTSGNAINPRDNDGISHLHIACTTNHARALEFFLMNGEAVDQRVDAEAEFIPGCGPLHVAVKFNALDVAEVLLKHGANVRLKDVDGLNPIDLCLAQNVKNASSACKYSYDEDARLENLAAGEKMMRLLMESDTHVVDDFGLTKLHLACSLGDTKIKESHSNLRRAVKSDAPIFPGYSALHFAATASVESVIYLLERGADITVEDVNGVSPLDICLKRYSIKDVCSILRSQEAVREVLLSDGRTKLIDLISGMSGLSEFKQFSNGRNVLDLSVPKDSPLWPGFTILHVAVTLTKSGLKQMIYSKKTLFDYVGEDEEVDGESIIEELLREGTEVTAQDARGSTPLHLAFHFQKVKIVELLLPHHSEDVNPVDEHNLSHLHVACAAGNADLAERLIANGADMEIKLAKSIEWFKSDTLRKSWRRSFEPFHVVAGSTALHVAVASRSEQTVEMLVKRGADLHAIDENGLTPIHRSVSGHGKRLKCIGKILLASPRLEDRVVETFGLSHLHVACFLNDVQTIERLLDRGADVNASVKDCKFIRDVIIVRDRKRELLKDYARFGPLRFVLLGRNFDCYKSAELLVRRGADFLAEMTNRSECVDGMGFFGGSIGEKLMQFSVDIIKASDSLRDRMKTDLGMTMLHFGCRIGNVDLVRDCLNAGEDVNCRMRFDSPIFPGCTPLHVLMGSGQLRQNEDLDDRVFRLLLDGGADVAVVDANNETPIHLCHETYKNSLWINAMFERYKDFSQNHIGRGGMSLLHIACIDKNAFVVEQFLKQGVDVNQTVDYLSDYGGYTPLHIAVHWDSTVEVIDLLLKYGANVNAKDRRGDTPLHIVASSWRSDQRIFIKKLFDAGADVNATNLWFQTPFEIFLNSRSHLLHSFAIEEMKFFLDGGCRINFSNPLTKSSIVSQIYEKYRHRYLPGYLLQVLWQASTVGELDGEGRTVLHNVVSTYCSWRNEKRYVSLLRSIIERGCDIDSQDHQGKTPLHLAVDFANDQAVSALLSDGADVNILDANEKTAYADAMETYDNAIIGDSFQILLSFGSYVRKMQVAGLFVHELNSHAQNEFKNHPRRKFLRDSESYLGSIVERMRDFEIGLWSMTLADVISGTRVVAAYRKMLPHERDFLNEFLVNVDRNPMLGQFEEFKCLIKMQLRKALVRSSLIDAAKESLTVLFGFWLPDICSEVVLEYLSNWELKNLIASVK